MSQALGIAVLLLALIASALASFVRLEVTVVERGATLRLRWLGMGFWLDAPSATLGVRWLGFNLVQRPLRSSKPQPKKPRSQKPGQGFSLSRLLAERSRMASIGRYLVRHTHLERLDLGLTLATSDPALTGGLYGLTTATLPIAQRLWPGAKLQIEADFLEEAPKGRLELALRLRTLRLVVLGWQSVLLMQRLKSLGKRKRKGGQYGTQGVVEQHGRRDAPGRQNRNRDRDADGSGG